MGNFYRKWQEAIRDGKVNPEWEFSGVVGFRDDDTIATITYVTDRQPAKVTPLDIDQIQDIFGDQFNEQVTHWIDFHTHPSDNAEPSVNDVSTATSQMRLWKEDLDRDFSDAWILSEAGDVIYSHRLDQVHRIDDAGVGELVTPRVLQDFLSRTWTDVHWSGNNRVRDVIISLAQYQAVWGNDQAWKQPLTKEEINNMVGYARTATYADYVWFVKAFKKL
jgi:hypothetical protein